MNFDFINYSEEECYALIQFNRPELFNAMNKQMKKEIMTAIKLAEKNNALKSILLTGQGKAFSSGQDLNDRTVQAQKGKVDLGQTLKTEWNPLVKTIRESKKPIIGVINGVCAGAGVSVALACDLLIAGENVKFISGFASLGLAPDAGSSYTLGRALGRQKALEFFLFSEALYGLDLKEAGLINWIDSDPLALALAKALQIAKLAPLSISNIKKNLQYAYEEGFDASMERETMTQRHLGFSDDYKEGVSAFIEKREANFKGI